MSNYNPGSLHQKEIVFIKIFHVIIATKINIRSVIENIVAVFAVAMSILETRKCLTLIVH